MAGFRRLDEDLVYDGFVIDVAIGRFETPEGEIVTRDVVHHPGAVAVVAMVEGHAVLVRQYRAACDVDLLELPAGKRDLDGEPAELTARRELREEVGLEAGEMTHLASFYTSPGFCDEQLDVFLATGCTAVPNNLQGPEELAMTIEHHALADVPALIASGELCDAKSIVGLLLAAKQLGE